MENLHVPATSFAAMAMSIVLSIGAPVALFFVVRKKYGKGIRPVLLGGAGFLLFSMILEQILHAIVLRRGPDGSVALMQRPVLYMIYGALAAGLFEETARLVSFYILKKRCDGFGTALKHGIGHGGVEAALIGGASLVGGMALAIMLNTLGPQAMSQMGEPVFMQAQVIAATQPVMLLVSGFERLFALGIQISLSMVMYYAVYKSRKLWLYPLAILLHALVDCPVALYQVGVITNMWLLEGIVLVSAVVLAGIAFMLHKKMEVQQKP